MTSADKGRGREEIKESNDPISISSSERILLTDDNSQRGIFSNIPNKIKIFNFRSASAKFKQMAEDRDGVSRSVASSGSHGFRERINGAFSRKIDWQSLSKVCKEWFRSPMNMALFAWIFCVAVSGAILFLVMTGMLNNVLKKKSQRDTWFEVNNQILNALFTLMCLYQHPKRFHHLVLLCRWKPEDISRLRKIYCKNGTYKPHEWAHMMVVVVLLHVNCFAQYALCGLNLGYRRSERPAIGVGICISFAIAAPAVAGIYTMVSPLGRDYDLGVDEESQAQISSPIRSQDQLRLTTVERRYSFGSRDQQPIVEERPKWSGGILDIWDDISLAYLSLFCTFCVFGWNMERLGFGNVYVHIATFMLFCLAPFWIFNLAAINIDHEPVREALGVTGIILCCFGLLYGGFWRIQMRKRFNLPGYTFCCGRPAIADCTLWLFCCWCSLAQEARTGNSYDIIEHKFYRKQENGNHEPPASLPREVEFSESKSCASSSPIGSSSSTSEIIKGKSSSSAQALKGSQPPMEVKNFGNAGRDETMIPPTPSLIRKDAV